MWWHIFCMWEWESFHGSCACGLSVAHSSCNFDGKGYRTHWSRYLWNLGLTSNFMCGLDLRRFPQRLITCPFENIVALKRFSQFWFPQCSCMRQCLVFSSGYCYYCYWSFSTCVFKCLFYMCAWKVSLIHCLHLFDFSPLCVFKCLLKLLASEDAKSHWLHLFHFSPMCVYKCLLKSLNCNGEKVILVAFVSLFSAVRFQMSPQTVCLWGCKVTLIAFVRLFPTVCFQIFPQMAYLIGCKVTLVAVVWLFSLCIFKCLLKLIVCKDAKSHWLHLFEFFDCAFSNVSSNRLPVRMQSNIGCICLTFLRCAFSNVSSNCLLVRMQSKIGCISFTFLRCEF